MIATAPAPGAVAGATIVSRIYILGRLHAAGQRFNGCWAPAVLAIETNWS